MTRPILALAALLALLGACAETPDTTAALLEQMLARYNDNRGGIGGFVAAGGGAEATHGALPDSTSTLDLPTVAPAAGATPDPQLVPLLLQQIPNVRLLADTLRTAVIEGPRDLRGHRVYILTRPAAAPGAPTLYVVVDAETFDVREIEQSVTPDSLQRPLVTRLIYDDFRAVDGFTAPFRIRQITEGVDQLIPETERIVRGGQATVARGRVEQMPQGPEREARRASLDREIKLYTQGIQETDLTIERLRVVPR
ncbi:MAG TPA: hypothetical protein VF594_02020 [Rubricoccaceae bacterium]|jgi:hypothetical protein